jgi:hypothetical protein
MNHNYLKKQTIIEAEEDNDVKERVLLCFGYSS